MTRRSPEGAFSAGDLPHRSAEELRELSRRADEVIERSDVMDLNEPWEVVPGPDWVRRTELDAARAENVLLRTDHQRYVEMYGRLRSHPSVSDAVVRWAEADNALRDGASSYIGADADGNPSGFARYPTFSAGEAPSSFPAQCAHCREVLRKLAEFQTHMRNDHPA